MAHCIKYCKGTSQADDTGRTSSLMCALLHSLWVRVSSLVTWIYCLQRNMHAAHARRAYRGTGRANSFALTRKIWLIPGPSHLSWPRTQSTLGLSSTIIHGKYYLWMSYRNNAALKIQTGGNGFQCWSFSRLWFNCSVRKARTGLNSRTKKSKFGAGELAHFYLVFKTLTFSSISYCCFEAVQRHLIILRLFHHYS